MITLKLKIKLLTKYGLRSFPLNTYSKPSLYCDKYNHRRICFESREGPIYSEPSLYSNENIVLESLRVKYIRHEYGWKNCHLCSCSDKLTKKTVNYNFIMNVIK
jgi:hypothetical protein